DADVPHVHLARGVRQHGGHVPFRGARANAGAEQILRRPLLLPARFERLRVVPVLHVASRAILTLRGAEEGGSRNRWSGGGQALLVGPLRRIRAHQLGERDEPGSTMPPDGGHRQLGEQESDRHLAWTGLMYPESQRKSG